MLPTSTLSEIKTMHEFKSWMPRQSARTRFFGPESDARGSRCARRWRAVALSAAGVLCASSTLAADEPLLIWLAGTWQCAGQFEPSGKPIEAHVRFDWNEAAGALVKHHDDRPPNAYHAVEVWGTKGPGRLAATIVDRYGGTRLFASSGWANESLVWTRVIDAKPVERFVYVRESEDRLRIDWATSKDGSAFRVGDTLSCERQKSTASCPGAGACDERTG